MWGRSGEMKIFPGGPSSNIRLTSRKQTRSATSRAERISWVASVAEVRTPSRKSDGFSELHDAAASSFPEEPEPTPGAATGEHRA